MRNESRDHPQTVRLLRRFFERRMSSLEASAQRPDLCTEARCMHVVGHLVERTVGRASLRAAARHSASSSTDANWKHHLMTAALTELRTLDL